MSSPQSLQTYYASYISMGGTDAEWRSMCKRSRTTTSKRNPYKRGKEKAEWYWLQWRQYFEEDSGTYMVDLSKLPKTHRQRYQNVRKWLIAGDKKKSYEGEHPAYKFDESQWSYFASIPGLFDDLNTKDKCDTAFTAYQEKQRLRREKSLEKVDKAVSPKKPKSKKKAPVKNAKSKKKAPVKNAKPKKKAPVKNTKPKKGEKVETKKGEKVETKKGEKTKTKKKAKGVAKRGRPAKKKPNIQEKARAELEKACEQSSNTEVNKEEMAKSTSIAFENFEELEVEDIELDSEAEEEAENSESIFASEDEEDQEEDQEEEDQEEEEEDDQEEDEDEEEDEEEEDEE